MEYIKNKWAYSLIWLTVLAIVIWIIAGTNGQENADNIQVNQETYTVEETVQGSIEPTVADIGYYLIKAENEMVRVYWVDGTGEHLHRETTIAYPLLNVEDQEMLDEGIKLETDEELAGFLENYDS